MKKSCFLVLLAVSLLLFIGCSAQAEDTIPLTLNVPYTFNCDEPTSSTFTFTADTTGIYTLFVNGGESLSYMVYDGTHDSIQGSTDTGTLSLDAVFFAGLETSINLDTYTYAASTVSVRIEPVSHMAILPDFNYHTADYGTSEALTVYTYNPAGSLVYRWVTIQCPEPGSIIETPIAGADQSVYVIPSVTQNQDYACIILSPDEVELDRVEFHVQIRSNLTASIVGQASRYVSPLESVTLTVNAHVDYGEIHYQWYYEGDYSTNWATVLMEGETGPSLTLGSMSDRQKTYLCRVDDYDGTTFSILYFYVYLENHLDVNADQTSFIVSPGDSVTLSASAACDTGLIYYEWSTLDYNSSPYGREVVLEGENSSSLTLTNVQTSGTYILRVTDDYGGQSSCWFIVTIPNGLSVSPVSPETVYAAPGDSVTLSVRAQCASGSISYRWALDSEYLPDTNGSSCTLVFDGQWDLRCVCYAVDQYQNIDQVYFTIRTAGALNAWPMGSEILELEAGETAVLSVGTYSADNSPLTYQWRRSGVTGEEEVVSGATGPSLEIDSHGGSASYVCTVADSAGHTAEAYFYVMIHSGLSVAYDYEYTALLGESVTLQIDALSDFGPITYQWYLGSEDYLPIEGATSAEYSTGPLTGTQYFRCLVSDGYEVNLYSISVQVRDPNVTVAPVGSTYVQCLEGEEITLAVSVSGITGQDDVSFYWQKAGNTLDEEGESISIHAETGNVVYTCEVYVNDYPYTVVFLVSTSPMQTISVAQPIGITFSNETPAVLSFVPDSTGMYSFSVTSGSANLGNFRLNLYNSDWEAIANYGESPFSMVLTGGETYYLSFSSYSSSPRSANLLVTRISGSHSAAFTLIAGQRFEFPKRNSGTLGVLESSSDAPSVVRTLCEIIAAVSPGTAHVTVTYENGYQLLYTVTVVSRNAPVLRVPRGTGTVQAAAFEGDSSIEYVRLGDCLYVGSRAFAGTNVKQVVFDIPSGRNPYISPDAFAGSSPLIVGNGYMREFAEQNGFEFLMIRHEEGGNG